MAGAEGRIDGFWAVIPAGGAGTRLWPLSRRSAPKFLHDLTGSGRTLLQGAWDRLEPLAEDRVVVVTGTSHAEAVARQLPGLAPERLLAEPQPRESMPAIGWAAARIAQQDPDAVVGSFAADHVVGDVDAFADAVREAVAVARTGLLVTIGITPTTASTGFGYIREGAPLDLPGAPSARAVRSFVEKPDAAAAQRYLASGEYRWNAGMFVARATVLLDLLGQWHPQLRAELEAIGRSPEQLASRWPSVTKISIDHAVAEPAAAAGRVAVVPARFPWDDVGDFDSLAALLAGAPVEADGTGQGPLVLGDAADVLAVGSNGLVVAGSGRLVALVGVEDLVVVDTSDAVLVVPRARAQEVKAVVEGLAAHGHAALL